ncbi:serine protease [Microcystis sp. LEGE 08355]|uniref:S1 family peptidase n=1 Tax=Microcystis sp. LEGE 08355 TaxID=1828687 RepID=UPI0018802A7D|nr:serine protease [Microcystis sp. LEGE 08355]MBE9073966.1 trypsin-like peptidase domain-containing protein [Microcystis sp. LEGE 08355]
MQAFLYPIEAQTSNADEQPSIGKMDEDMIRDIARLITVRVYTVLWEEWPFTTDDSGSGVIVDRQEIKRKNSQSIYNYLVLTNAHVLSGIDKFYIQTHEGFIHRGQIHPNAKFEQMGVKADLALLWFESPYQYETAIKKTSENLPDKSDFFVTGFPCKLSAVPSTDCSAEFLFTKGKGWVIDRYLKDGYQLAFTNDTEEGTSGGAILDHKGHLVGINGRGKTTTDALQNNYADNERVPLIIQENAPLSLGLPIDWYLSLNSQQLFRDLPTSTPQLEPIGFLSPVKSETRGVSKLNPMTAVDRLTLEQKLNMILILSGVLPFIVLILIILVVLTILKNIIENFWIYFHPTKIAEFQIESNDKIKIFISNSEKVIDFTTNKSIKLAAAQNCQIILTSLSLGSHQNKNIIPKIVDNNQNYYRYELEEQKKDQKVIYKILCRGKNIKLIHTRSKIETVTVKFEFQDNTGQ